MLCDINGYARRTSLTTSTAPHLVISWLIFPSGGRGDLTPTSNHRGEPIDRDQTTRGISHWHLARNTLWDKELLLPSLTSHLILQAPFLLPLLLLELLVGTDEGLDLVSAARLNDLEVYLQLSWPWQGFDFSVLFWCAFAVGACDSNGFLEGGVGNGKVQYVARGLGAVLVLNGLGDFNWTLGNDRSGHWLGHLFSLVFHHFLEKIWKSKRAKVTDDKSYELCTSCVLRVEHVKRLI